MKKAILWAIGILIVLITVLIFTYQGICALFADIYWWESVGRQSVFYNTIVIKAASFAGPFLAVLLLLVLWFYLIRRVRGNAFLTVFFILAAAGAGVWGAVHWNLILINLAHFSFGSHDPFFGLDANFYMNRLPLVRASLWLLSPLFAMSFFLDIILHRRPKNEDNEKGRLYFSFGRFVLSFLTLASGILLYVSYILEMLVTQPAPKIGIGFTQFYGVFMGSFAWLGLCLLFYMLWVAFTFRGLKITTFIWNTVLLGLLYLLGVFAYPALLDALYVRPNELMVQRPFIDNRKDMTRLAFNLSIHPMPSFDSNLTVERLSALLNNLRVWDSEPYQKVIKQVQEIKTYFDFSDVDVDIYRVPVSADTNAPGSNSTQVLQVVLAAREMNIGKLPAASLTWDNIHLRYTHGNGVVVSPAHLINPEGGPVFWLRDMDNTASYSNFVLRYPQIYFGELTTNYIVVNTKADEFEYTSATNRITTRYTADRGVKINGFWKRLVYSVFFREKNILITQYFSNDSRIIYNRQINERVKKIFPFLEYDNDPYIAVIGGRLVWIIDAYTVSSRFPLSEKFATVFGNVNYIRNTVKATVDAYTGDVELYVVDKNDPFVKAYQNLFPALFKTNAPPELQEHFRYPYSLVRIQSQVLCTYHVLNAESFYNSDDVWSIPSHLYGDKVTNFDPYYLLTSVYGRPQFAVIQPFTPMKRDNLASWLMACYPGEPRLYLYWGSEKSSLFGPMQVESKINQDDNLSRLFTLWGQKGSRVFRGNIKFLPVGDQILYIEPIFLESVSMSMPQLVKVVAIYENTVYIGSDYSDLVKNIIRGTGQSNAVIRAITNISTNIIDYERP